MKNKILLFILLTAIAAPVFAQDADMTLIPYRKGDLWGYAGPDKIIVIEPAYSEADFFYEGYASVKKGEKFGYINKTGKVVIPFKFFTAKPFHFGYFAKGPNEKIVTADDIGENQKVVLFAAASLRADGYEVCINTKGETMPKCPAISENSAPDLNKPSTVVTETNYSTIQKSELFDKIVDDYKMLGIEDNYYIAVRNNKQGVFNNKFEVIVPFDYDSIKHINIGGMIYLLVAKNGLKGVFFGNGSPYITTENSKLVYVKASNGKDYFIFAADGKAGIKNLQYQNIVQPSYTDVEYDPMGGFVLTGDENKKGFYFYNGTIIEPKYVDVKPVKGGKYVLLTSLTGKKGYVNEGGIEFFEE